MMKGTVEMTKSKGLDLSCGAPCRTVRGSNGG